MKSPHTRMIRVFVIAVLLAASRFAVPLHGSASTALGNLVVANGNGSYRVVQNNGSLGGTISDGLTGVTSGCAFDASTTNLVSVNTTNAKLVNHGNGQQILTGLNPQSVVFAANRDLLVGHKGGEIRRYAFNPITQQHGASPVATYFVPVDSSNSFWFDLAPRAPDGSQNTIFYTSGGRRVHRFDFSTQTASVFATLPGTVNGGNIAAALRLLPPAPGSNAAPFIGGLVVADGREIKRLNASGAVVRDYDSAQPGSANTWFALALDPKDVNPATSRSFWSGDLATGTVTRFNLNSGAIEIGPVSTGIQNALLGICLDGEPVVGQYTQILEFTAVNSFKDKASFNSGTENQHDFTIELDPEPIGTQRIAVSVREVISDGVCPPNNPSDVDCGFVTFFSAVNPVGARIIDDVGTNDDRALFYHVDELSSSTLHGTVTIEWENKTIAEMTPSVPSSPCSLRALRIFRDPTGGLAEFSSDQSGIFFIDEPGMGTFPPDDYSRFMAAFACTNGSAAFDKPVNNTIDRYGRSIPVEFVPRANNNPILNATTAPHSIATTIGFNNGVVFAIDTPGQSNDFWKLRSGKYFANIESSSLPFVDDDGDGIAGPYNFCVSDQIAPPNAAEPILYHQQCVSFFLRR